MGPITFVGGPIAHVEGHVGVVYVDSGVDTDWLVCFCRMLVWVGRSDAMIAVYYTLSDPDIVVQLAVDILGVRARVLPGDLSFLASCSKTFLVIDLLSPLSPILGS